MAQEIGLLPAINDAINTITAKELANVPGADKSLIVRIMRVLTSVGLCDEVDLEAYKANCLSKVAGSLGGQAAIKKVNELLFTVGAQVQPYMRQHGFQQFPPRPPTTDLAQFALGGMTMWEYLKSTPEMKYWFDTLMAESRSSDVPWYHIYPFVEEIDQQGCNDPESVLLVDVGGNRGADVLDCRRAYPDLRGRFVLQDLPETISQVDPASMDGIELQAYDIFTPQPVVGAKVYFMRRLLHDFDDDSVRKLLPNTIRAMGEDSKLLIHELVLPNTGASIKTSHLDILMMLYHSGRERSLSQWKALLEGCGLEIAKIWSHPDSDPSILECQKTRRNEHGL